MSPTGLAILLGAGPVAGAGIARILASPAHGNLAVALLSRSGDTELASNISKSSGGGTLRAFKTDTSEPSLTQAFQDIKAWSKTLTTKSRENNNNSANDAKDTDLKLKLAIFSIKHSHKTPFAEETAQRYTESMTTYATGAVIFAQLATSWMLGQYPEPTTFASESESKSKSRPLQKKGTLIFTGTLGALRTNTGYAAYGGGRAAVRMLAQSLAREYSALGVHVVHAIANGGIADVQEGEGGGEIVEAAEAVSEGRKMRAESVGRLYLAMMEQSVDLWVHELDMRPAAEKF